MKEENFRKSFLDFSILTTDLKRSTQTLDKSQRSVIQFEVYLTHEIGLIEY